MGRVIEAGQLSTWNVCSATGVTERQLDYWVRIGIVEPTVPASGSGSARRYAPAQLPLVCLVRDLMALGVRSHRLRDVIEAATRHGHIEPGSTAVVVLNGRQPLVCPADQVGRVVAEAAAPCWVVPIAASVDRQADADEEGL